MEKKENCNGKEKRKIIIPSSRSTSFCNFCTERSANSARASACDENNQV